MYFPDRELWIVDTLLTLYVYATVVHC